MFVEFTGVWSFGALLADDAELFWRRNVSLKVHRMSWVTYRARARLAIPRLTFGLDRPYFWRKMRSC